MRAHNFFGVLLLLTSLLLQQKGSATNQPEKVRITMSRNYYSKVSDRQVIFSINAGNQIALTNPEESTYRLYFTVSQSRYINDNGIDGIEFVVESNSYNIKGFYLLKLPDLTTSRNGVNVSIDGYNLLIVVDKNGMAEYFYASF